MFPLFHIVHACRKFNHSPDVVVGAVLPDVLRYAGWPWNLSHSCDRLLLSICELRLVANAAADHISVDGVSDASFGGINMGWAFYKAMGFMGDRSFRRHASVWVWALHNVIEGIVELPIWRSGLTAERVKQMFDMYAHWDALAGALGMDFVKLKDLYTGYVAFSISRYDRIEELLVEIVVRKFNRYSLSVSLGFVADAVEGILRKASANDLLEEIWQLTGGDMGEGVSC